MNHGFYTGKIGKHLSDDHADSIHQVFYDHGEDPKTEPYYCKPTPFFGKYSRDSTLSCVDIAVVNQDTKSVELIAEIEESGQEPKKIIGDIVNLFLADRIRVKGKDYWLGDVVLVLGVRIESRGKARAKIIEICEKLTDMNALLKGRSIAIILVFDQDLAALVSKVHDRIEFELARLDEPPKKQLSKSV